MAKKLANKHTKQLMTEAEIQQKSLNKADFTSIWQGKVMVLDASKSHIAKRMNLNEKGEFAIRTRG